MECKKPVFVAPSSIGEHSNPTLLCACRKYIPCVYVVNKVDQITLEELEVMDRMPHYCPVSAHLEWNLDGLLDKIWEYLNLIRVSVLPPCRNPILIFDAGLPEWPFGFCSLQGRFYGQFCRCERFGSTSTFSGVGASAQRVPLLFYRQCILLETRRGYLLLAFFWVHVKSHARASTSI